MAARLTQAGYLHELKVTVPATAEPAASAIIENQFGQRPVAFSAPDSPHVDLSLFLPTGQRPSPSKLTELRNRLKALASGGRPLANPQIRLSRLANRDWKEAWKHHFKPLDIGRRLLLRPSWSRRRARPGQRVVILDPGLSFGTGQHPTTSFCLREIVRARQPGADQSLLDMGTGSGILAIAAAKLGYRPVHGFDYDQESVRVALNNARRNRVDSRIRFRGEDLSDLPDRARQRYDVVCANLLADLLTREARKIRHRVEPGGVLIIAGILRTEFESVETHFTSMGARRLRSRTGGEWRSGSYRFLA